MISEQNNNPVSFNENKEMQIEKQKPGKNIFMNNLIPNFFIFMKKLINNS